jgi:hypothetical protein
MRRTIKVVATPACADARSRRRELAHETDRLDNLRGDLPALTGVLGVVAE